MNGIELDREPFEYLFDHAPLLWQRNEQDFRWERVRKTIVSTEAKAVWQGSRPVESQVDQFTVDEGNIILRTRRETTVTEETITDATISWSITDHTLDGRDKPARRKTPQKYDRTKVIRRLVVSQSSRAEQPNVQTRIGGWNFGKIILPDDSSGLSEKFTNLTTVLVEPIDVGIEYTNDTRIMVANERDANRLSQMVNILVRLKNAAET